MRILNAKLKMIALILHFNYKTVPVIILNALKDVNLCIQSIFDILYVLSDVLYML